MTCPSSVPSGCSLVGGSNVPGLIPRGRHSLSGHCGASNRRMAPQESCLHLLAYSKQNMSKSSLLNTCANMHISVTSIQSDKPACHQAQAGWQLRWSQVAEKGKLRVADWHLGAVMMFGYLGQGASQVPVVCRRAGLCLMKPLSPPPLLLHSITAERWATWKWAASSQISKSPVATWWQQSSEQEPALQHKRKMNNL